MGRTIDPSKSRVLADYVSFFHTISCLELEAGVAAAANDATKNGDDCT